MVQFCMAEISPAWKKKGRGCQISFSFFFSFLFFSNFICLYIPCIIGFPVEAIELTPMQTKSPKPVFAVWLTITVPKAPKGQGETRSESAWLAFRIQ